ncbi:MAG: FAD-binding oxidoreductase [Burkholderiaceae bacterium]|nr:FAD-binding oxidoreductase [Burkholderiaceae bacterium]
MSSPAVDRRGLPDAHVSIIGAGIVGVCCALYLRLAGIAVTLFDRGEPGSGCSAGNAGMLGVDSCVPLAMPGAIRRIPSMLRSADASLGVDLGRIPSALPWFLRFSLEASPARVAANARALHALQRHLPQCYQVLLDAAGAGDLVRREGKLHLCESEASFLESQPGRDIQREHGVEMIALDPREVIERLPALTRDIHCGVFYPNAFHSIDPRAMVMRFAQNFRERGGVLVRDEIRDIEIGPSGPLRLVGAAANYPVRRLVIAGGIDSASLAARFGTRVPMIAHRGYNLTLQGAELGFPVKSEDRKIVLTPMRDGVRVTGIAEIAAPAKPPTPGYADRLAGHASAVVPGLTRRTTEPWVGSRPCTPDSLPVLGRCPRFADVVYAYGHGHLGLGLGAVTGRIVSQLLAGDAPLADLQPYRPDRFRLWEKRSPKAAAS